MSLSLYDVSIPVYLGMLRNLAAILEKAEAHASAHGVDPATYLEARLAPDMHPLSRQIQMASDAAKGGAARLAGLTPPAMPDEESAWPEFKDRIARTIAYVQTIALGDTDEFPVIAKPYSLEALNRAVATVLRETAAT